MTVFTGSNIDSLNNAMRANKNVNLGTVISGLVDKSSGSAGVLQASGAYTATSDDASNAKIAIPTGVASLTGFMVQVRRSGSAMPFMAATAGSVAGTIKIIKDPSYTGGSSIAAGDVATWFAF